MNKNRNKNGAVQTAKKGGRVPEEPVIILEAPRREGFDIGRWRTAIKQAEDPKEPDYTLLYDIFNDIMLDSHLTSIINKRIDHIKGTPLVFSQEGKENPMVSALIGTPWFDEMLEDLLGSRFWGYTASWLDLNNGTFRKYQMYDRRHIKPLKGMLLVKQDDRDGIDIARPPYDRFIITAGKPGDFGLLIKAVPWVLLKRGDVSDWATFNELFAMPFRKGTYPQFSNDAKLIMEQAMKSSGSAGYAIVPEGFTLEFIQNTSNGSTTAYMTLAEFCDKQLSKLFLQSTMTVEAEGGQYKGEVHERSEEGVHKSDERYLLGILNTKFRELLATHGFNPGEGRFTYVPESHICLEKRMDMDLKLAEKIVIPPSYWYEKYNMPIPEGGPQYIAPQTSPAGEGAQVPVQNHRDLTEEGGQPAFYDPRPKRRIRDLLDFFS